MDFTAIMKYIQLAIQYGPAVKAIIDEATGNDEIVTKISHLAPVVGEFIADVGGQLFPHSTKSLQTVGAAVAAFDPNTTKWLQKSLNAMIKPSPNLEVDGIYGQQTIAAVRALQTQLGLNVDGIAGKITQAAIQASVGNVIK